MAAGDTYPLGPGELTIGATATPIDVSCLVNNAILEASKDEGDSVTKLCGTVKPGAVTYTYELTGNMDVDITDPAGIFALSHANPGAIVDYSFTPNTEAGTSSAGTLRLDPLAFGGDETGEIMNSDFTFTVIEQDITIGTGVVATGTDEDNTRTGKRSKVAA